jgi:hypothetical protein
VGLASLLASRASTGDAWWSAFRAAGKGLVMLRSYAGREGALAVTAMVSGW